MLYHGTLLDSFDLDAVGRLLRHPPREPGYRAGRPHGEFLANLGIGAATLAGIVRRACRATATAGAWPRERVARLTAERFANVEWTRRL